MNLEPYEYNSTSLVNTASDTLSLIIQDGVKELARRSGMELADVWIELAIVQHGIELVRMRDD